MLELFISFFEEVFYFVVGVGVDLCYLGLEVFIIKDILKVSLLGLEFKRDYLN